MRANGSRGRCADGGTQGWGSLVLPRRLRRCGGCWCQNPDVVGQTHPCGAVGQVCGWRWSLCSPSAAVGGQTPNVCGAAGGMEGPGFPQLGQAWLRDGAGLSRLEPQFGGVRVGPRIPVPTAAPVETHQGCMEETTKSWPPGPAPSMCCCRHRQHPSRLVMLFLPVATPRYPDLPRATPRRRHPRHPRSAFPCPRQPFPSTDPLHKQRRGRGRVAGMLIYSPPLFSSLHPSGKGLCRYKQTLIKSCLTGNGSSKQQARKLSKSKGSCFCCCRCCLHSQMSLIL